MNTIGTKIHTQIPRPSRELVEKFRGIPVANLDDCMGRIAAVDAAIRPINSTPLLGCAFTIRVPQGDNLMFHKAMDMARPGDVIVIDAGGDTARAIFGELMITYCKVRKLAGVVVDGCIRDYDTLKNINFPVYARGITPNGPYKNGPGEINVPVSIGGKIIHPGDILVGDGDGLLSIRPEDAPALLSDVKKVMEKEKKIMEDILGKGIYPRPWVDEKLAELKYEGI